MSGKVKPCAAYGVGCEGERHDTPTWELCSNLRLLWVNLLKREPAKRNPANPAAVWPPPKLTAVNLLIPFAE